MPDAVEMEGRKGVDYPRHERREPCRAEMPCEGVHRNAAHCEGEQHRDIVDHEWRDPEDRQRQCENRDTEYAFIEQIRIREWIEGIATE